MDKCKLFLELSPKFKWFIDRYMPGHFVELKSLAEAGDWPTLAGKLNDIWFFLPDYRFNIKENPPGWAEFLRVIED